jgi:hypothetical protein
VTVIEIGEKLDSIDKCKEKSNEQKKRTLKLRGKLWIVIARSAGKRWK